MKTVKINKGDLVVLHNGTTGIIDEIDKSVCQFMLNYPYIIWFHLMDIKVLNGKYVESEWLSI